MRAIRGAILNMAKWQHPTGRRPETVNIVALGPSSHEYHAAHLTYDPQVPPADETWTLNKGARTIRADLVFVMDDLVGETRKSAQYADDLKALQVPIMTSIVDSDVEALGLRNVKAYPLQQVLLYYALRILQNRGHQTISAELAHTVQREAVAYLHNSLPYMLAYAGFLGVRDVRLFGADYTHPDNPKDIREDDRACCEYWVGMVRALGVGVSVTYGTTLLNKRQHKGYLHFYGFGARQPVVSPPDQAELEAMAHYLQGEAQHRMERWTDGD